MANTHAIDKATAALLAALPTVPYGYYIAQCYDPEGGCIGWHCYVAVSSEVDDPAGGFAKPTGLHYCDGGHPVNLGWLEGRLPVRTPDEVEANDVEGVLVWCGNNPA